MLEHLPPGSLLVLGALVLHLTGRMAHLDVD